MEYSNKDIFEYINDQQNLIILFDVKYESPVLGRRYECLVGTIENFYPIGYRKIDVVQDMILTKNFLDEFSKGALEFYKGKLKEIPLDSGWTSSGKKCRLEEIVPLEDFKWENVLGERYDKITYINHYPQ